MSVRRGVYGRDLPSLTMDVLDELYRKQGASCAICGRLETEFKRQLHVDHDHVTGRIRGLLCVKCNAAIGFLDDSPDRLRQAIAYLEAES